MESHTWSHGTQRSGYGLKGSDRRRQKAFAMRRCGNMRNTFLRHLLCFQQVGLADVSRYLVARAGGQEWNQISRMRLKGEPRGGEREISRRAHEVEAPGLHRAKAMREQILLCFFAWPSLVAPSAGRRQ